MNAGKNIQEYFSLMQKNCSSVIEIIAHGFHGSFINELVRAVASSYEVGYSFISGKWDAALAKEDCFNADNSWSCLFEEVNFCSRQNIKDISTIQYLSKVKESYPSNLSLHLQIAEIRYNANDYLRSNIWDTWMKKFDVPASFIYGQFLLFLFHKPKSYVMFYFDKHKAEISKLFEGKKVMCIHYRAFNNTHDVGERHNMIHNDNRVAVELDLYIKHVDDLIHSGQNIEIVYISSDIDLSAEMLQLRFPNRKYKFIVARKVSDPLHVLYNSTFHNTTRNTIAVFLDMDILSDCDSLLVGYSNWATILSALMKAKKPTSPSQNICSVDMRRFEKYNLTTRSNAKIYCIGDTQKTLFDTFQYDWYINHSPIFQYYQIFDTIPNIISNDLFDQVNFGHWKKLNTLKT